MRFDRVVKLCAELVLLFAVSGSAVASELAELIETGQRREAIELIQSGAEVNEAQGDGTTPLHWAVYGVDLELTTLLLEHGADPNVRNAFGSDPLGEAIRVAAEDIVRLLLDAGADATTTNVDGQTSLMLAARAGSTEVARLLIEQGVDVNAREAWRNQSALIWAADARQPEIVDLLIEHGAEIDFRAASIDWPSQITSEPRAQYRPVGGLTPLLYAARSGCTACVRSIVAAGADIDRPTPEGMTPLMIAIDNEALDTALMLLELGANPHVWDWYGRTALYVAADKSQVGRGRANDNGPSGLDLMRRLLEAGVDPNPQLNMHRPSRGGNIGRFIDDLLTTGCTPLLRVASSQDLEAVHLLLANGADVDLPNIMGVTPLMAVAGTGGSRGGIRSTNFGSESRAIQLLEVLVAAGADVNARIVDEYDRTGTIGRASSMTDRQGQSSLFAAVTLGWVDVVEFLVRNGADVTVTDMRGISLADIALDQAAAAEAADDLQRVDYWEGLAARLRELGTEVD